MPTVRRTAAARKDYLDIFLHVAEDDVEAARRLIRLFHEKSRLLAEVPRLGQRRDELCGGMRSLPVGNYLIFYREAKQGGIELIRVLHGARNLKRIFRHKRR